MEKSTQSEKFRLERHKIENQNSDGIVENPMWENKFKGSHSEKYGNSDFLTVVASLLLKSEIQPMQHKHSSKEPVRRENVTLKKRNKRRKVSRRTARKKKRREITKFSAAELSHPAAVVDKRPEVLAGVILPVFGDRPFTVHQVAPALEKAVDEIVTGKLGFWNFKNLTLVYADSQCDIAVAMNKAVIMAERKKVVVFFGPVCDYAVAPVARQAIYWDIPVITAGATAYDFHWGKAKTYRTLTRVGPANIQGLVEFLEDVFLESQWKRLKVIYDSTGQDKILYGFCHLLVEYMHIYLLSAESNITMDHQRLDIQDSPPDIDQVMRKEIGTDHSGE
ncbi:Atrial natriuretic peptide clearance receptor [Plakobranchus ocellatus]|uniref:Atrial natriuretic peptide clearance receptor n=1 Tax=Plakobranchus ocellatus TaxID=259542 RepID=A0AAV4CAZ6_9GAST|nr:Atrial natriuretic peptide clearance receptor [Plakobranchus ocellatus]